MARLHDGLPGEIVAMGWHFVWTVLCVSTLCFSIAGLYAHPQIVLAWTLKGQIVMSAGGTLWHLFGALEHWRDVKRLSSS